MMSLSPFAQYCIRKLLRQDIEALTSLLTSEAGNHWLSEASLEKILNNLYLNPTKATAKVSELELLTKLYQDLEKAKSDEATLTEIKRRIFQLLGFQTTPNLPSNLPLIVPASRVAPFRFYHNGKIRDGMHYEHEIYGEIRRSSAIHRLQTYQLAWALLEQKVPVVVTASAQEFILWVSLRSPSYPILLRNDATFLRMLLFLHATMHRGKHLLQTRFKQSEKKL